MKTARLILVSREIAEGKTFAGPIHMPGMEEGWQWFVVWEYSTPEEKWVGFDKATRSLMAIIGRGES